MDLLKAVKTQSLDVIKKIVDLKGIPIDDDWKDYDILNEAVKLGKNDVAKYLLMKNCRVNKTVDSNTLIDTPLHHAIKLKDLDLVASLLEKKASVEVMNDDGDTSLQLAFINEQSSIVDLLLAYIKQNSMYENSKNKQGLSHLHIASTREDKEIIEKFLESGADVSDAVNEDSVMWAGFTALHFAVQYKSVEAVNVLSDALLDLEWRKIYSIKNSCAELLHKEIEKSLMIEDLISLIPPIDHKGLPMYNRRYNRYTNLLHFHMALSRGDTDLVRKFIANGVAVRSDEEYAMGIPLEPLHFAVESNWKENVELLLNHGANINTTNDDDMTPVHLALYNETQGRNDEIVDLLYKAVEEAKKNCTDRNGLSYLHVAATRNDLETVGNYLDDGIDVNTQVMYDKEKFYHFSPLHFAVLYGKKEVAELLIDRGANVNLSDNGEKGTPLHIAVEAGNADLIELLLENGADVEAIRPSTKETVLHLLFYVLNRSRYNLSYKPEPKTELLVYIDRFVKMGCDINAQDIFGHTALHECILQCHPVASSILHPWIARLSQLGADVNLQDDENCTPLQTFYKYYEKDHCCESLMLLYDHVQKLKALGMTIHQKNLEYCDKYLEKMKECEIHSKDLEERLSRAEKERLDEIGKLKETFISDYEESSLHDLLISNSKFSHIEFRVRLLEKILKNKDFEKLYPSYGYLIRFQCKRLYECKGIKISQKRNADVPLQGRAKRRHTSEVK